MTSNIIKNENYKSFIGYKLAQMFYLLFWLLKPFYLQESGTLQIGDLCMGIAFILLVVSMMRYQVIKYSTVDGWFLVFLFAVAVINLIYSLLYANSSFLKPILYYVFAFLTIYASRAMLDDDRFLRVFAWVLKLNLWIQLLVYAMGWGRWFFEGLRYQGTYNDPNQLAFALLTTYCLLYCISRRVKVRFRFIYFLITLFLIYQTSSTGMLFAILILFACEQYFGVSRIKYKADAMKLLYYIYLIGFTVILVLATVFMISNFSEIGGDSFVFARFEDKLNRGDSFIESFVEDRSLEALVEYPQYMLFGAGEGLMPRFGHGGGELHSTWLSILFYYGIIPFCFLIIWIYKNLRNTDRYLLPVYICVFLEALTLINHRQPSFWTLIVLGSIILKKNKPRDDINELQSEKLK